MDLEEQLTYASQHQLLKAFERALQYVFDHQVEIIGGVREGITEGYPVYGDSSWSKTDEELEHDMWMEARDLVTYALIRMNRGGSCAAN